jgi:hypothetical protein
VVAAPACFGVIDIVVVMMGLVFWFFFVVGSVGHGCMLMGAWGGGKAVVIF